MSDNKENLESELLAGIGGLAKDDNVDSHEFMQNLYALMDSDEFTEVSDEMALSDKDFKEASYDYKSELERLSSNISKFNNELSYKSVQDIISEASASGELSEKASYFDMSELDSDEDENPEDEFIVSVSVGASGAEAISELNQEVENTVESFEDVAANTPSELEVFEVSQEEIGAQEESHEPVSDSMADENVAFEEDQDIFEPGDELEASSAEEAEMIDDDQQDFVAEEEIVAASSDEFDTFDDNQENDFDDEEAELYGEPAEKVKKKKNKKNNWIYDIILVASLGVFIYCAYTLGDYYYKHFQYKKGMDKLQNIVGDITIESDKVEVTPSVPKVELKYPDEVVYVKSEADNYKKEVSDTWAKTYANLVELNPDCAGWLKIPGTRIDYPLMYTPNEHNKYLYKDFEGKYFFRGLPYLGKGTLLNISQNYLIMGHHMNDGTAFHDLVYFLRRDFAQQNKYAYLNTGTTEGKYELMAVVESKIFNTDDNCFKFYNYTGDLSEKEFNTYVSYMKKLSYIKTDVNAVYGDQLISLCTCYRIHDPEGRLVVVFKRIQ